MSENNPITVGGVQLLTRADVAKALGVSVETVKRRQVAGDIPGRKVGRQWLTRSDQLLEWLTDPRRGPTGAAEEPQASPGAPTSAELGGDADANLQHYEDAVALLDEDDD